MTATITRGHDTYITDNNPNTNFADAVKCWMGVPGSTYYTFVYLPLPDDIVGRTIASATLIAHASGAFTSVSVGVRPVQVSWAASTITWNNGAAVGSATNTTPSSVADGGEIDLDATAIIQAAANVTPWYGFRVGTTSSTLNKFRSFENAGASWSLVIEYSDAPEQPQSLVPNGTTVASGAPVVSCDFNDNGGLSTEMGAIQVQVSTSTSFASPAFDSGTVASIIPQLDLAAAGFTPVSSGTTRWWRVRVQDTSGLWSAWSDPVSFTYRSQPSLTVNTPAAGIVWDPTSDIIATFGASLSKFRVQVTDGTDRTFIRYDSGVQAANPSALTQVAVTLPQEYQGGQRVLVDDSTYQLHIRAWDTRLDRQSTPGSPAYVDSWTTFTFNDDAGVPKPLTLVADQVDFSPSVVLTWTRAAAPDAWVVLRGGRVIARLDPADVIIGTSTYSWTDQHPRPWVNHNYTVKAISGGHQSQPSPTASITPDTRGVWLITDAGDKVRLDGNAVDQLIVNDRRAVYKPINLRYDVDIVAGFEGLSGTFSGTIASSSADPDDSDILDQIAILQTIKENPADSVRLIFGLFSGRVLLRNVSIVPSALGTAVTPAMTVSFGVNQVADFDQVI